ncbi:HPF/RaiA family ribosome-associated protein [Entomospira nematocerorum]|uniref:HPF/RaiA family ribosome-associated protein n=1 Tax=Entomospira nematocerorum TaxID=2719987 RepID=A0A968KUM2_9SPIO|nr:HPF/RaiA family ribosome-associated protein [Entomospira nematocera]NIZ47434.1 HPF/RaiA family ribosome-associated protein [Entomospira nematocera]WDI34028.1 HPF/RaiA family ribosome-associated protein [Entomospira nematocera]
MEIEMSGVHYHISSATKEHIYKKAEHFQKMGHLLDRIHVSIKASNKSGHENHEVHLHGKLAWHNAPTIEIYRTSDNLWGALDDTFDAFNIALNKHKHKHTDFNHERISSDDEHV